MSRVGDRARELIGVLSGLQVAHDLVGRVEAELWDHPEHQESLPEGVWEKIERAAEARASMVYGSTAVDILQGLSDYLAHLVLADAALDALAQGGIELLSADLRKEVQAHLGIRSKDTWL